MGLVFTGVSPRNCSTACGGQVRSATSVACLARSPLAGSRPAQLYSHAQAFISSSCFRFAVCLWNEVFLHYQDGQKGGGRIWDDEHRTLTDQPLHSTGLGLAWKWAADQCWRGEQLPSSTLPQLRVKKEWEPEEARDGECHLYQGDPLGHTAMDTGQKSSHLSRLVWAIVIFQGTEHVFLFTNVWLFFPYHDVW